MIVCVPSLGVLASTVLGKVAPPSVESRIVTFGQFTGAWVVFATSHVTVCWVPPTQVTLVFGAVTLNGPAPPAIVMVVEALATPPPPLRLSRAVSRNFIARLVVGSDSPKVVVLLRISESFGNVRDRLLVGANERKIGRLPLSVSGGEGVPRSNSSQS